MIESSQYHRQALRCVRTAERPHDPGERAKLFEIARAYLGLARHIAGRHDRGSADRTDEYESRRVENP